MQDARPSLGGEEAREPGISSDVIWKRIAQGSLTSNRPNANVLVWVDGQMEAGHKGKIEGDGALVEALRDEVPHLKEQLDNRTEELREHRLLLAGFIERSSESEVPVKPAASS